MNYDEILAFLAIVEEGSIAKAAEILYISQGAVSQRVKLLESKLDACLFERSPGKRNTQLTLSGENLLPIAQQIHALWKDAKNINEMDNYREFKISSLDSFNLYYFNSFYKNLMEKYKELYLTIFTYHSSRIHELIENQSHDIGFVFGLHNFPNVVSLPLFFEDMVVICHKDSCFVKSKSFVDLDAREEIHVSWSTVYEMWHTQNIQFSKRKKIVVGTAAMIPSFLTKKSSWSIVPETMAKKICNDTDGYIYVNPINSKIPKRIGYALYHKYLKSGNKTIISNILKELRESIKCIDTIQLYDFDI